MVKIASKDFNMDMDKYIKDRRSKNSSDNFSISERLSDFKDNVSEWKVFSLFRRNRRKNNSFEEIDEDESEDYSEDESEIEAIDEIEDELEERRESILKRFFKRLRFSSRTRVKDVDDDYDEENDDEVEDLEDIREVIKITHKWLEHLPPEEIERFKRSEDFVKYKVVLKKLGMIK